MKILVIGSAGRLGAALMREWSLAGDQVIGLARPAIDLMKPETLEKSLEGLEFDVAVNCAAQTNVDYCEKASDEARVVNADSVGELGRICRERGARLIHISTDYVFDGETDRPYTETDEARPISGYGQSKRDGELALMAGWDRHLVVRVSWVFGPDRPSFVDQILAKAREQEVVEAIGDKWATPTYTLDCAILLRPLLAADAPGGIMHLCNVGACTWQEYGQYALNCAAQAGLPLKASKVGFLRMQDLKAFIAKRPRYTAMDCGLYEATTGLKPRTWQEAVQAHVQDSVRRILDNPEK